MSVQVQLRRDTLANILAAAAGAQGELWVATDTNEVYLNDGSLVGGHPVGGAHGTFGSLIRPPAIIESSGAGGETLGTGVTSFSSTLKIPAGWNYILWAGWLIKTSVTGVTTVDFGVTGDPVGGNFYFKNADSPSLTAGSTSLYQPQYALRYFASPTSLLFVSHAATNITAGAIRFAVCYMPVSAPSS
ncbi:MAG: hypothetical protein ACLPIG_07525 [Methylocella sp.]